MTSLAMPAKYVEIDSEEMTYISGGCRRLCTETTFKKWVNSIIIVGMWYLGAGATISACVKSVGWSVVKKEIKNYIVKKGFQKATATTIINLLDEWMNFSCGQVVAQLVDKYDATGGADNVIWVPCNG